MPRLIDTDALKFPNIAIFDMKLHGVTVPMVRLIDLQMLMPTVDAAPVKHGRWIPVLNGIDDDTNPAFDCSECDAMCRKKHNYCPVCGAKMDLEENDAHTDQTGK